MFSACRRSNASGPAPRPRESDLDDGAGLRAQDRRSSPRAVSLARVGFVPSGFEAHEIRLLDQDLRRLLDEHDAVATGIVAASAFNSVVLPVPVPPEMRMLFLPSTARRSCPARSRERSNGDEVVQRIPMRELPHGQRRPINRARREHRGHTRAILQPCVEHRLVIEISSPQARAMFLIATVRFAPPACAPPARALHAVPRTRAGRRRSP